MTRITEVAIGGHAYQPDGRFIQAIRSMPYEEAVRGTPIDFEELTRCPYANQTTINYTGIATEQCYAPCARQEILDHSSAFDFAPSLLGYLSARHHRTLDRIIESDRQSQSIFNGHGSAIETPQHHIILPFASQEIKQIQTHWGRETFRHHFNRDPEGMWLPEAAIDRPTVEIMRDSGIKFTVLAPQQALWVRRIEDRYRGNDGWEYIGPNNIDTRRAYELCDENSGESLGVAAFFINKQLTEKMALKAGECGTYSSPESVLWHIKEATGEGLANEFFDLETIGHHNGTRPIYTLGEALKYIHKGTPEETGFKLTNLAEHLANHPPEYDVKFIPMSSWSCMWDGVQHRLGRWGDPAHTDCNCGGVWNSEWRRDLRGALDGLPGGEQGLAKQIDDIYFRELGPKYFNNPMSSAMNYIKVLLGEEEYLQTFLRREGKPGAKKTEFEIMYKLLEALRLSMIMNTSCAWFHDGLQRIEPTMNFVSAQSALELLKELPLDGKGYQIEDVFLNRLSRITIQIGGRAAYVRAIEANPIHREPYTKPLRARVA